MKQREESNPKLTTDDRIRRLELITAALVAVHAPEILRLLVTTGQVTSLVLHILP